MAFPGNTAAGASQLFIYIAPSGPAEIDVTYAPTSTPPSLFTEHLSISATTVSINNGAPVAFTGTVSQCSRSRCL